MSSGINILADEEISDGTAITEFTDDSILWKGEF